MQNRLLYDYYSQKNRQEESRRFRLFVFAQVMHYSALLVLFLGGLFFVVVAMKVFFS